MFTVSTRSSIRFFFSCNFVTYFSFSVAEFRLNIFQRNNIRATHRVNVAELSEQLVEVRNECLVNRQCCNCLNERRIQINFVNESMQFI